MQPFVGATVGISTLSADARSEITSVEAAVALYKPDNGPAINAFAGVHVGRFFSVQGNYVWNRNGLSLFASRTAPADGRFYQQSRDSIEHALIADALVYFRAHGSGVRPYLSTGVGMVRFDSPPASDAVENGMTAPDGEIRSMDVALRVAVGIDLAVTRAWSFRYSFSETITSNPVSGRLQPRGERLLANFQNLFGLVLGL